jgi:hypothetical protein
MERLERLSRGMEKESTLHFSRVNTKLLLGASFLKNVRSYVWMLYVMHREETTSKECDDSFLVADESKRNHHFFDLSKLTTYSI